MSNFQWQNIPTVEITIPEVFKNDILAYARSLDSFSPDPQIDRFKQVIEDKRTAYGADFKQHLLEQCKTYIEMADRVSSRRLQTNGFFITILSGLLGILAFIFNKDTQLSASLQNYLLILVSLLGISLSYVWSQAIESSKKLNSSKFKVINAIESFLATPGYDQEWKFANSSPRPYKRATQIENYLPIIFVIFWFILLIYPIGYSLVEKIKIFKIC